MKRGLLLVAALVAVAAMLVLTGCYTKELPENQKWDLHIGDGVTIDTSGVSSKSPSATAELDGAEAIEAHVRMGVGNLELGGGAESGQALNAKFEYRPASWRPNVEYSVEGTTGALVVEQPDFEMPGSFLANSHNEWELALSEEVPIDVRVDMGAGNSELDFSEVDVRNVDLNLGTGNTDLDLSGPRTDDVSVKIQAGVGNLTLQLPADVGVRVTGRHDGIGNFETDEGFHAEGNAYVNDAYDTAETRIEISLQRGVGNVELETVQ